MRVGPEAHVAVEAVAAQARRVGLVGKVDVAAPVAEEVGVRFGPPDGAVVGDVDPVVEAVEGFVGVVLRVGEGEASEHYLAHVGAVVAIGVFEVEHVRWVGDDDAVFPAHDAGGQRQAVSEERCLVRLSVAVGVFEQLDAARAALVERIPRHLNDEDPPVFIDVHRHRIHHQRLGNDAFDPEAVFDLKGDEGVFWRIRRTVAGRCR